MKFFVNPLWLAANLLLLKRDIVMPEVREFYKRMMIVLASDKRFDEVDCRFSINGNEVKASFCKQGDPLSRIGDMICTIPDKADAKIFKLRFSDDFSKEFKNYFLQVITDVAQKTPLAISII